jgi:hypothetical protein
MPQAQTPRERIEAALKAKSWSTQRTTTSSIFSTKAAGPHALFAIFQRSGSLVFATYDGKRISGADAIGQIITKINAS